MADLNTIAEELFNKIRSRFQRVSIGDEDGNITNVPSEARFFDFSYTDAAKTLGKISMALSDKHGLSVIYSQDIVSGEGQRTKQRWFDFLKELRYFAKKRLLDFDVRNITKSNLNKKDYRYLANANKKQVKESAMYGTSRVSYQDIDGARLVIKHTDNINTESATGRARKIGRIYIESPEGERFRYPYRHLKGARAMARHVAEGGNAYDDFGKHIVGLSEEVSKLRKFKRYMGKSSVMAESLSQYTDVVDDRIKNVLATLENLQKKHYYAEAFENFEPRQFDEVPSDVRNNWIDQLTIKQFNEELEDVFPYIYKLVNEADKTEKIDPEYFEYGDTEEDQKDSEGHESRYELEIEQVIEDILGQFGDGKEIRNESASDDCDSCDEEDDEDNKEHDSKDDDDCDSSEKSDCKESLAENSDLERIASLAGLKIVTG